MSWNGSASMLRRVVRVEPAQLGQLGFSWKLPELIEYADLSDREFDVFKGLVKGMGVNDIANHLSISNKTVSTHKARLLEKMQMASIAELTRYAMDNQLLD